jgi:hypothetical protein
MEMIMKNKNLSYLLSILIILVLLSSSVLMVGAAPLSHDEAKSEITQDLFNPIINPEGNAPAGLSDGTFTYLEPPYLSEDGNTLYNADLPRVLVIDPNPEMQDLRFPQDPDIAAAIAGTRSTRTTFSITFKAAGTKDLGGRSCTTFPAAAKTAFNAAAAIWASRVQSSVPIKITACWSYELPENVLGGNFGKPYHRNFDGAPLADTWYDATLANAFAGYDLEPTKDDMHITYSASFNWYYGTDGNTPSGQIDLVSVATHEIGHGLNFAGFAQYRNGSGLVGGYEGQGVPIHPSIFDRFMEDGSGKKLITYPNPSLELGSALTSNNLWWNGTNANAANGGGRVKMYAPSTWKPGSSYSHLDYNTFAGTPNSMMVPSIGSGSSQHNPGPVTMGILQDMGWNSGNQPSTPTGVSASDGTFTDKVRVSWSASTGATYYQVFRHNTNDSSSATSLTSSHPSSPYDDTSAVPGTTYYYWVKACNSTGCSDFSASDSGNRAIEITPPSPPTGVSASDGAFTDKVRVTWGGSGSSNFKIFLPLILAGGSGPTPEAPYFQVYRNTTNSSAGATKLIDHHPSHSYDDTSAVPGTTYYYWVKACNSAGCSGFSASDSGYREIEVTKPLSPTGISASDGTYTDKVQVAWTASADATTYQVFRHTSNTSSAASELTGNHPASPYNDTSAVAGTTYYYWVKACNSAGCSGFSTSDSGYRASEVSKPSPPTDISASDGTYTDKVQVSWTASADASYYQVFRNTSNDSSSAGALTGSHLSSPYNDTSAGAGTTYYYWVKACNSAGCSGFSASDSGYRATEGTTPSPPTNVSASDGTYTDKVQVSWTASAGATTYQVFSHTSNNSSSATPLADSTSSPYNDTSAEAGTTYYYWVKACNSTGCSGFSASDSGYRATEGTTPSPPTNVSASDGTYTDKVQVSWTASAGATTYQVFSHTSNNSSSATQLADSTSSPYNDTSAEAGTTYYYWVKACNSAGCSGFSASDSGYRATEVTKPSPPTDISASDGTYTDKVQVSWTASAGATSYQVFRYTSDDSSTAGELTGSHPSSPYDDTSADAGTTYYYWVKACNSVGCSGFSASDSGFRQDLSGGFNSQFDGSADGWGSHAGTWYLDYEMGVLWTEGIEGTSSSVSYAEDFDNFDYQVRLGRLGSDTSANRIYVRGTPSPLLTGNRWYSGYAFQYNRNGQYSIFKYMPNGDTVQIQGWTLSSAINQGDYYNILRVVANGSDFSFYINGTLVWQGSDTTYSSGVVGIGMYRAASTGLTEQLIVDWAVLTTIGPGGTGDSGSTEPILQDPERIIDEMIIDRDNDNVLIP